MLLLAVISMLQTFYCLGRHGGEALSGVGRKFEGSVTGEPQKSHLCSFGMCCLRKADVLKWKWLHGNLVMTGNGYLGHYWGGSFVRDPHEFYLFSCGICCLHWREREVEAMNSKTSWKLTNYSGNLNLGHCRIGHSYLSDTAKVFF